MKVDIVKLLVYVGVEILGMGYQIYCIIKVEQFKMVDIVCCKVEQEQIIVVLLQQEVLGYLDYLCEKVKIKLLKGVVVVSVDDVVK